MSYRYKEQLELDLRRKRNQLNELYEKRAQLETCKETWWQVQSGINSLSVDIATKKSRIENMNKTGINLPDHDNTVSINKYI